MKKMKIQEYFKQKFGSLDFLFDSHTHLTWFDDNEVENIVTKSKEKGIKKIIDIGVDLISSKKTIDNAKKFSDNVYACVGIDPEIAIPGSELFLESLDDEKIHEMIEELEKLLTENRDKIIMLGETGLDNYWILQQELSEEAKEKSRVLQRLLFRKHLEMSEKYEVPLSIHHRNSYRECLEMVSEYPKAFGIFHSFVDGPKEAQSILEAGFGIGINGIVTYRSAESIRQAIKPIMEDSKIIPESYYQKGIFFETDAPFLIPRGAKGKSNLPENINLIYDYVSKL